MRDDSKSSKLTNVSQIPKKFGNNVFGFSHFIILPEESPFSKCRHFLKNLEGSCGHCVSSIGTETKCSNFPKNSAQIRAMKKDQLDSVVARKDIFMAKKRLLFKKITNVLKTGRKSKYLRYLECYWKERGIEALTDDTPSKKRRRVAVNDLNVKTKRRKLFTPDVWLTCLSEEAASGS
ncbi:hypothetical protein Trydic_g2062 [Trypoxylus dichotomus]